MVAAHRQQQLVSRALPAETGPGLSAEAELIA